MSMLSTEVQPSQGTQERSSLLVPGLVILLVVFAPAVAAAVMTLLCRY